MKSRFSLLLLPLLLILFGCSPAEPETPSPRPTPTPSPWAPPSPSPEPSPSPSVGLSEDPSPTPSTMQSFPPAPEDESEEMAAVRKGWEAYQLVVDKYSKDISLGDLTETQYVTTGQERLDVMARLDELRHEGVRLEGDVVFTSVTIDPPTTNADGVRVALVTACYDPSRQKAIVDATGELYEYQLTDTLLEKVLMEMGSDGVWRAALYGNEVYEC